MSIFARIGTIVGKLGLIADSNLNTVLDRVIDFNSTGAIETYIRELKDSSRQLDQAVAETIGRIKGLNREKTENAARATRLEATIDYIINKDGDDTNNHTALPYGEELVGINERNVQIDAQIEDLGQTRGQLEQALGLLNGKIGEMDGRLKTLKSTTAMTEAKEEGARALSKAAEFLGKGPGASVDNAMHRAEARKDTADATLDRTLDQVNTAVGGSERRTQAEMLIASMQKPAGKPEAQRKAAGGGRR